MPTSAREAYNPLMSFRENRRNPIEEKILTTRCFPQDVAKRFAHIALQAVSTAHQDDFGTAHIILARKLKQRPDMIRQLGDLPESFPLEIHTWRLNAVSAERQLSFSDDDSSIYEITFWILSEFIQYQYLTEDVADRLKQCLQYAQPLPTDIEPRIYTTQDNSVTMHVRLSEVDIQHYNATTNES